MRRFGPVLVPVIALLLGCAAATPFVAPQLSAQQQHVPRWEYYCVFQGAEGWEMTGATNATWCFKRPR